MSGYFYIVHIREFINSNQNVYKIGKTQDILKRSKQYPKGSIMMLTLLVNDRHKCENSMKKKFKKKFKQRTDIGLEYYEGDLYKMIRSASKTIEKHFQRNENNKIDEDNKSDKTSIISNFINDCTAPPDNNQITITTITEIYKSFNNWCEINEYKQLSKEDIKEYIENKYGEPIKYGYKNNRRFGWININLKKQIDDQIINEDRIINILPSYINQCIEKTDNHRDILPITDIYNHYKSWHKENYSNKTLSKKEIREQFDKVFGTRVKGGLNSSIHGWKYLKIKE